MNLKSYKESVLGWCKKNYIFLIGLLVLWVAANLFLYQFYHHENYVYFWDWSFYQSRFAFIVGKFHEGFLAPIKTLVYSIAFTEQSLIAPFIIAPFGLLFGTGRSVFLFSVLNVFALPTALMISVVFMRLTTPQNNKKWGYALIPLTIALLTPQFWIPITLGFYDVSTLIVVCVIWLLLLSDWSNKPKIKATFTGILLTTLIFIRRWYGYWVFSFFPAVGLEWLVAKAKKRKPFLNLKLIFICGISAFLFFLLVGAPIMYEIVKNNYAEMFSAFKHGDSTLQVMLEAVIHYGWFSIIFAVAGFILAIKNNNAKSFLNIIGVQTLLTLYLFSRVQRVDQHHHYQFMIVIILFQALFLLYLWRSELSKVGKYLLTTLFCLVTLVNFTQALIPQFSILRWQTAHLFAGAQHYPLVRHDTKTIENLMSYLNQNASSNSTIYVAASSLILNDDILKNSCYYLSFNLPVCQRVLQNSSVDLRDGFPQQFLRADYVVVGDPIQYHLRPQDQRVVGVLADEIINKNNIGNAFELMPQKFTLDNGVEVKIYKKDRNFTPQELQNLKATFLTYYPGENSLFNIPLSDKEVIVTIPAENGAKERVKQFIKKFIK